MLKKKKVLKNVKYKFIAVLEPYSDIIFKIVVVSYANIAVLLHNCVFRILSLGEG